MNYFTLKWDVLRRYVVKIIQNSDLIVLAEKKSVQFVQKCIYKSLNF